MPDEGQRPSDPTARTAADIRAVLAQLGPSTEVGLARRRALPFWIEIFSWLFLLIGASIPVVVILGVLRGTSVSFMLFGFSYSGRALDLFGLLLACMLAGCAVTAYGLLWGRSWGQFAAMVTGWAGLVLCAASVIIGSGRYVPLEPLLLVPFLVTMHRLKGAWNEHLGD